MELERVVARLAQVPSLLVCLDFDGTLSELGTDAYAVRAHPDSLAAIEELAHTPRTEVAVLTGRHLDGLRQVFPLRDPVILVGSHGAEPTTGALKLARSDRAYLDEIEHALQKLVVEGVLVEVKPYQRVIHVAALAEHDPEGARAILARARELAPRSRPVTNGHNIVEFSAIEVTKGSWLAQHKQRFDATFFAGDDTTDETALEVLGPCDVGVKVGSKPSVATHRVAGVTAMAQLLTTLAEERRRCVQG